MADVRDSYGEFMTVFSKAVAERSVASRFYACAGGISDRGSRLEQDAARPAPGHRGGRERTSPPPPSWPLPAGPRGADDIQTFHAYRRTEGICGIIISDHAYPAYVRA